jgi:IS5 family transposase
VRFCEKTVSAAKRLLNRLQTDAGEKHRRRLEHHIELAERVIDQTRRRVWSGESVPAGEKVVSIFEEHTDVIVKGGREGVRSKTIGQAATPGFQ